MLGLPAIGAAIGTVNGVVVVVWGPRETAAIEGGGKLMTKKLKKRGSKF